MRAALFLLLLAVYLALPRLAWTPEEGLHRVPPMVVSGDEPHYLLMVNSLLQDRDLILGPGYQRVLRGGPEAGRGFRKVDLDHHTILIDPLTGQHQLWQRIFDWHTHLEGGGYQRIAPGFESGAVEVPAHPPAFSALIALAALPFRAAPEQVEGIAITAVAALSFLALAALFFAARRAGFTAGEATAAVLLTGLASSFFAYARSLFTEPAIALALVLACWALAADRPRWAGAACFAAAALKPPFGLVALGWAALLFRDRRRREARALLEVFFAGCAALAAFNFKLAHTPAIAGASGFVSAAGLSAIGDQQLAAGVMIGIGSIPFTVAVFVYLYRWLDDQRPARHRPRRPTVPVA